jgi:hypothetical protein
VASWTENNKIVPKFTCIICLLTFCLRSMSKARVRHSGLDLHAPRTHVPLFPFIPVGKIVLNYASIDLYEVLRNHPSNKMQLHCGWYQAGGRRQRAEKGTWHLQYMPFVHKCMLTFFGITVFLYVRACSLVDRHQHCLHLQDELQREGVLTVYCNTQRNSSGPMMADIYQKLVHQAGCMFCNPWH